MEHLHMKYVVTLKDSQIEIVESSTPPRLENGLWLVGDCMFAPDAIASIRPHKDVDLVSDLRTRAETRAKRQTTILADALKLWDLIDKRQLVSWIGVLEAQGSVIGDFLTAQTPTLTLEDAEWVFEQLQDRAVNELQAAGTTVRNPRVGAWVADAVEREKHDHLRLDMLNTALKRWDVIDKPKLVNADEPPPEVVRIMMRPTQAQTSTDVCGTTDDLIWVFEALQDRALDELQASGADVTARRAALIAARVTREMHKQGREPIAPRQSTVTNTAPLPEAGVQSHHWRLA